MKRKAQIRISETIAVLFIFFILILFGIIFYYKYSQISVKEYQEELLAKKAMETTLKTLFLPELICSKGEAEPEDNCIDLTKLRQVNRTFDNYFGEYYSDLFPYATITVEQIYPEEKKWVIYNKTKIINGTVSWKNKEATYFVVALRDDLREKPICSGNQCKVGGKYGFGFISVEVYS